MLFSDVEGSTLLLSRLGDAYVHALDGQRSVLRSAWSAWGGVELGTEGDSFFVVFTRAGDAVAAAMQAQRELAAWDWPEGEQVRVRMGVPTGSPMVHGEGYVGMDVHRAARISAAAHGGQVLLSEVSAQLVAGGLPRGVGLLDLGSHRLKDIARPERLFQLTGPGLDSRFPALRTLGAAASLPRPTTPLVGRSGELRELQQLLTATSGLRLVTLTGPGGSGKTRLATALAAAMVDSFTDGIYFVSLAAASTVEVMWTTITETLDAPPDGRTPEGLFEQVGGRQLLLVLDNLEQLADAGPAVAQLLAETPNVVVVATSRRPLHVAGEYEHEVPPLELPTGGSLTAIDESGAVQLFMQRAQMVKSSFRLTDENAASVAAICRRLDGLPLAIEIAAARIKLLSPHALLARLDKALDLDTGDALRPTRQQTLRHAISWSYRLLKPTPQALLQRLSVFAGGADLGAVSAVSEGVLGPQTDPLDVAAELVDASLAGIGDGVDGEPRISLLETVRAFALDELAQHGELEVTRAAHASHFVGVARALHVRHIGTEHLDARRQLEIEQDNLREALAWTLRSPNGDGDYDRVSLGVQLCRALGWFWRLSGNYSEARDWTERALALSVGVESVDVAKCLESLARILYVQGERERSRHLAQTSVQMLRRLGDKRELSSALRVLATVDSGLADPVAARRGLEESVAVAREADEQASLSYALLELSNLEATEGNLERSMRLLQESLPISQGLGDEAQLLKSQHNMACTLREMGRPEEAEREMTGLIEGTVRQRSPIFSIIFAEDYAAVLAELGEAAAAARLLGAAEAERVRVGLPRHAAQENELKAPIAKAKAALHPTRWADEHQRGSDRPLDEVLVSTSVDRSVRRD
jgi:predicted ATPase/class 3 adenylate cyclase